MIGNIPYPVFWAIGVLSAVIILFSYNKVMPRNSGGKESEENEENEETKK